MSCVGCDVWHVAFSVAGGVAFVMALWCKAFCVAFGVECGSWRGMHHVAYGVAYV